MRSCRDVSTGEVAVETAQLAPKMSTTIMPVDLPPTHSPCKNASYALRPCNSPRTDNSTPIRDAYSHNCRFNYYRTGCWREEREERGFASRHFYCLLSTVYCLTLQSSSKMMMPRVMLQWKQERWNLIISS